MAKHLTSYSKVAGYVPTCHRGDCSCSCLVYLNINTSRYILPPEIVYTASCGMDVKPLVPGAWIDWHLVAISGLVSHYTWWLLT